MPISYTKALNKVRACVRSSGTSFGAGMAILPKDRRNAMYGLYAFCRIVDDIADSFQPSPTKVKNLNLWRSRISNLFQQGQKPDEVTTVLHPAIAKFGLIEQDFQDIIDGMEMDAHTPIAAPTLAVLDLYCDRVASAVGRASVRIFGETSDNSLKTAHHLGRALQLTNILRDIAEDATRGRLYLPQEYLQRHGITHTKPEDVLADPNLPAVCRDLAIDAAHHYAKADEHMGQCSPKAMAPARMMRLYYGAIFDKLCRQNWQSPLHRVSLPKWQKIWLLVRGLCRG